VSDALIDDTAHTCLLPEPFCDKRGAKSPPKHAGVHMAPASASNFMGREGGCHEEEEDEKEEEGVSEWLFNLLALLVKKYKY